MNIHHRKGYETVFAVVDADLRDENERLRSRVQELEGAVRFFRDATYREEHAAKVALFAALAPKEEP